MKLKLAGKCRLYEALLKLILLLYQTIGRTDLGKSDCKSILSDHPLHIETLTMLIPKLYAFPGRLCPFPLKPCKGDILVE